MMRTKRSVTIGRPRAVATAVAAAALLLGCSAEDAGSAALDVAPAEAGATIGTAESEFGTILVDGDGMTLYLFTSDSPGISSCTDACLAAWPPLLTGGAPVAEAGTQQSRLGTLTRDDGTTQVSYAGWPLYRYAADGAAGDVNGQGVGDVWFVIGPDGTLISGSGSSQMREDVYGDSSGGSYGSPSGY